jgi:hypothetical protein
VSKTDELTERLYDIFAGNVVLEAEVGSVVDAIKAEGAREAVQTLADAWAPDDSMWKDPNSDMAVGYRHGLLAGNLRLRRWLEEHGDD